MVFVSARSCGAKFLSVFVRVTRRLMAHDTNDCVSTNRTIITVPSQSEQTTSAVNAADADYAIGLHRNEFRVRVIMPNVLQLTCVPYILPLAGQFHLIMNVRR